MTFRGVFDSTINGEVDRNWIGPNNECMTATSLMRSEGYKTMMSSSSSAQVLGSNNAPGDTNFIRSRSLKR